MGVMSRYLRVFRASYYKSITFRSCARVRAATARGIRISVNVGAAAAHNKRLYQSRRLSSLTETGRGCFRFLLKQHYVYRFVSAPRAARISHAPGVPLAARGSSRPRRAREEKQKEKQKCGPFYMGSIAITHTHTYAQERSLREISTSVFRSA